MKAKAPAKQSASPLLLVNIRQLLTLRQPGKTAGPRRGPELNQVGLVEDAAIFAAEGKIVAAGRQRDVLRHTAVRQHKKRLHELDCAGKVVLPGFVDSHTHPVFIEPRLLDFEKRIAGATYEEIAAAGGGIHSSVDPVRKASVSQLAVPVRRAFAMMGKQGTTTIEAKSGYGLSTAAEIKSLEAIKRAGESWPGTVVPTLLGAHVVPRESKKNSQNYVREVCRKMIPQVARRKLASFVDVFCERGAFSVEDAEAIFEAAVKNGLGVRAHVCQLSASTLWPLLRFNPASLDHMDCVQDDEIPQLAKRNVVATLLPGANYFLGLGFPPARRLIDSGVAIALATDYNPGTSPTTSMPFVLSLGCTQMKMSPAETIAASTINAAHALRLQDRKGSIEVGKDADLAVFAVSDYREIPYWFAANLSDTTIMNGVVFSD